MADQEAAASPQGRSIAVFGGGPAGLMAAGRLAEAGCRVTLHDAMPSLGRKFLMAGRGGLNLTHSEPLEDFLTRYGAARDRLEPMIRAFPPDALRRFADDLGQETFVGSSGRIFPKAMKASPMLRAWLARLTGLGVEFRLRSRFAGFDAARRALAAGPEGAPRPVEADALVLALGGASWPRLGADGSWRDALRAAGAAVTPFAAANAGVLIAWSAHLSERFAGAPLKSIRLSAGGASRRGEAIVTRRGLEGGAVYALNPFIREALAAGGAFLHVDLKPDMSGQALAARIARPRGRQSLTNHLRKATGLAPAALALLREAGPLPEDAEAIAARIKALPLPVTGLAGLERAISSAGGIAWEGVDAHLMLKALPGVFVAGEMLDWEAPTGGYLLQACFATGLWAGQGALDWLAAA